MKSAQKCITRHKALNKVRSTSFRLISPLPITITAKAHREGALFSTALNTVICIENGTVSSILV